MRFGIVGIGKHGSRYLRHLNSDIEDARIISVSRRDKEEAEGGLKRNEIDAEVFTDYRDLCRSEVDSVTIATPTGTHKDIALEAIGNGKNVLVEKPLAGSVRDCQEIIDYAAENRVQLMVSQTLRYNPTVLEIKKLTEQMGGIRKINMQQHLEPPDRGWLYDPDLACGGVLLNTGVHIFDTIRFVTGEEIIPRECTVRNILNGKLEDLAFGYFDLGSGGSGGFSTSRYFEGRSRTIEVECPHGRIVADAMREVITITKNGDQKAYYPSGERRTLIPLIRDFMESVENGIPPPITGEDGSRAVECSVIFRSLA